MLHAHNTYKVPFQAEKKPPFPHGETRRSSLIAQVSLHVGAFRREPRSFTSLPIETAEYRIAAISTGQAAIQRPLLDDGSFPLPIQTYGHLEVISLMQGQSAAEVAKGGRDL